MPIPEKPLTDAEMRSSFSEGDKSFNAALQAAMALVDKMQYQQESAKADISVGDLRQIVFTLFAFQKLLGSSKPEFRGLWNGDRGSNCDYNPFNGVNFNVPRQQ
jgi:hypothetical protein